MTTQISLANPHIAIMTNPRVLAISDNSTNNKQVKRDANMAVWSAEAGASTGSAGKKGLHVALFKLTGAPGPVSVTLGELGIPAGSTVLVQDTWKGGPSQPLTGDAVSKQLSPCSTSSKGPCTALLLLTY
jgi:hypothetical protein